MPHIITHPVSRPYAISTLPYAPATESLKERFPPLFLPTTPLCFILLQLTKYTYSMPPMRTRLDLLNDNLERKT